MKQSVFGAIVLLLSAIVTHPATAQIIPDQTLPTNSVVTTTGNTRTIMGGTVRGSNLFHSFGQFSVPTGSEAYFNNGSEIQNILTRVTGNAISNIDGLIRANGTANLFFLNPNGIIFGPNARLEVGGSFFASTANSFKPSDGSEFSATNPQNPPLLTLNVSLGLQYGKGIGKIQQSGSLAVPKGQSLILLGSDVTSGGTLTAPGGRVEVLGDRVALLDNAQIDVSSPTGGGTVLIGGDYRGQGSVPNALQTYVAPAATINADATSTGNGGKVIVWSDGTTRFYGNISARGGAQAGNGGTAEVSGSRSLTFNGLVDTSAPSGLAGILLLDPTNITVVPGNGPNPPNASGGIWGATEDPGDQTIGANAIVSLLNTNALTLEATDKIAFVPNADVVTSSANTVTLHARTINFTNVTLAQLGAGNVILDTTQNRDTAASTTQGTSVVANNSYIGTVIVGVVPQAGNIEVTTGSLTAINGAEFGANTFGEGNAGSVKLTVSGAIHFDGAGQIPNGLASVLGLNDPTSFGISQLLSGVTSVVAPGAKGNGGSIELTAGSLTLTNGATLTAGTFGEGNAGSVKLTVSGAARFDGVPPDGQGSTGAFSVVYPGAKGNGGSIELTAGSLTLTNGAEFSAASNGLLTLTNGATLSAATAGIGDAGSVKLKVSGAAVFDGMSPNGQFPSGAFSTVQEGAEGNGGNIKLSAGSLTMINGAQLSASTLGNGDAGDITVNVNSFNASVGGQVLTETSAAGRAGNIVINVIDSMTLSGKSTGIFASTAPGSTGNGGSIKIDPQRVLIQDGAAISVNSQGSGVGGNIFLQADRLELRDQGSITAETASARGGNITLNVRNLVLMRRNSLISATAGTAQSRGDGGNITIRAPFIVGVFSENSDIAANAFTGRGGNITITTDGIYGLQFQKVNTPFSDITASSSFGVSGTVTLNTPNVDPSRGLTTLPINLVDPSRQITNRCAPNGSVARGESRFTVTGRGGLPASPDEAQTRYPDLDDLGPDLDSTQAFSIPNSAPPAKLDADIVEAQGWISDRAGNLFLVTQSPQVTPHSSLLPTVNCRP